MERGRNLIRHVQPPVGEESGRLPELSNFRPHCRTRQVSTNLYSASSVQSGRRDSNPRHPAWEKREKDANPREFFNFRFPHFPRIPSHCKDSVPHSVREVAGLSRSNPDLQVVVRW